MQALAGSSTKTTESSRYETFALLREPPCVPASPFKIALPPRHVRNSIGLPTGTTQSKFNRPVSAQGAIPSTSNPQRRSQSHCRIARKLYSKTKATKCQIKYEMNSQTFNNAPHGQTRAAVLASQDDAYTAHAHGNPESHARRAVSAAAAALTSETRVNPPGKSDLCDGPSFDDHVANALS